MPGIINDDRPIMQVEILSNGQAYIHDTGNLIRVYHDPRDIIGRTIGNIKIESLAGVRMRSDNINYMYYYNCRCIAEDNGNVCNTELLLSRSYIFQHINDENLSCGCLEYKKFETDILGTEYNQLTPIEFHHWEYIPSRLEKGRKEREYYYVCRCRHGRTQIEKRSTLISLKIKGCKCNVISHKDELPGFYNSYRQMMARCYNSNNDAYENYGGRGIKVCPEWKDNYLQFKEDMYQTYCEHADKFGEWNTTIERINVNEDYSPENCMWSTRAEQNRNRRNTRYYEFNGKKYTINYLLNHMCDPGMDYEALRGKLRRNKNMCVDDVIINGDIFKNPKYRKEQEAKGLRFPINYTTNVEDIDISTLPTDFNYMTKEEACRKDDKETT